MNFGATPSNPLQLSQLAEPIPAPGLCASCAKPSDFSISEGGARALGYIWCTATQ